MPARAHPAPAKVSVRLQPAAGTPAPAKPAPTNAILPLRTDKPVAPKRPKAPPAPQTPLAAVALDEPAPPLPTISQPPLTVAPPMAAVGMPLIETNAPPLWPAPPDAAPSIPSDVPPPPSVLASLETPGGHVLVVAALVNDAGVVVDSRLLVPSGAPLKDITMTLQLVGQTWADIDPPMLAGEFRWFELRIDHTLELRRELNLP